jgi:hypothetical protein
MKLLGRNNYPSDDQGKDDAKNRDVDVLSLEERLGAFGDSSGDGLQPII